MTNVPFFKKQLNAIANLGAEKMANILICTSILGWLASSGAQLIGIAKNKDYTKEQRHFLLRQEGADAIANIGLFFLVTKSCKNFASKLVSTGKLAPKFVTDFLSEQKVLSRRGNFNFNIANVKDFKNISSKYNNFKNFAETTATVAGGILSSNIFTPILRNSVASKSHNAYLTPNKTPYDFYKRHTFNDFQTKVTSI